VASNEPASDSDSAWNPTEEDVASVRGRHRLPKQRTVSRGTTVLGVATMAAVGVGGVAAAEGRTPPIPISVPHLPIGAHGHAATPAGTTTAATGTAAGGTAATGTTDAGEQLRNRILAQARGQQNAAETTGTDSLHQDAAKIAAKEAAARKVREAAAKKKAAQQAKEEADRKAALNRYVLPTTNFHLTARFGQSGTLWAADHTGLDFAAPTGTAVYAVHRGEITSAGWAGSYGYRIVVTHPDGTQTWYCHLSSMVRTSGSVAPGDTIGRVGATGNVTGPHLHLEVRPGGGAPIDPLPWLRDKGLEL
jgi:murein DD-endopeptidase MepM/ murein hydrolase activator NlpD